MSGRIFQHALQFHELAELAWSSGLHAKAPYAVVANYAFSVEIILKSLSPKQFEHTNFASDEESARPIDDVQIASMLTGHPLSKLLEGVDTSITDLVASKYQVLCGNSLKDDVETCSLYFVKARYAYEKSNAASFDLSAVRRLSRYLNDSVISHAADIDARLAGIFFQQGFRNE